MTEWIQQAIELDRDGKTDAALDVLYDSLDDLCLAGKFSEADGILLEFRNVQSIDLLLGALCVSRWYQSNLKNRQSLLEHCRETWPSDEVDSILKNL